MGMKLLFTVPIVFLGFVQEKESKDRLGRRKSSIIAAQEQRALMQSLKQE